MPQRITTIITSLALIGAIFAGVPSSVRADAAEIYVGIAGADYTTAVAGCRDLDIPILAGSGVDVAEDIADASVDADSGGTIYLCPGTYHFLTAAVMQRNDITLKGAGATQTILDGGYDSRIVVTMGNLLIESLTMQNARGFDADEGGAVLAGGTVDVTSVTFKHNFANKGGGAIAAGGTVVAYESVFTSNTAHDQGGAIASHSFVFVYDSSFTSNSSIADENCVGGGGAIASVDDVFVERSTFTRNTAVVSTDLLTCEDNQNYGGSGGAIGTYAFAFVQDSTFSGNTAAVAGGAIMALDLTPTAHTEFTIERSTFIKNRALYGGALYVSSDRPLITTTITGNVFKGNSAKVGAGKGSWFRTNSGRGGAVYAQTQITMTNNRFSQNRASVSGGAAYLLTGSDETLAAMTGNRFVANIGGKAGGAVGYNSADAGSVPTRSELHKALRANRFSSNAASRGATIGASNVALAR